MPLIITEGKTDKIYLKAALKKLSDNYPNLIRYINGKFDYQVTFLNRSKRFKYFFNLDFDGADTLTDMFKFFYNNADGRYCNYYDMIMRISKKKPKNPIIFIFDNELDGNKKPLAKFISTIKLSDAYQEKLKSENWIRIENVNNSNIFLVSIPIINGAKECEIEDLFDKKTLSLKINGRVFNGNGKGNREKYYSKNEFAEYIMSNYRKINFDGFKQLLSIIDNVITEYKSSK